MVKVITKEADTVSTVLTQELSMQCSEASYEGVATITTILDAMPRPHPVKSSKSKLTAVTSRKWSPRET